MKVLAGHRAGLTTIVLPKRNEPDLEELPDDVRSTMNFVPVENIDEALKVALLPVGTEIESPEAKVNREFQQSKAA
jgi:ATP-dependent Lon protease